jgi:hypothetical protein
VVCDSRMSFKSTFLGPLVDNFPGSTVLQGVNENLEEEIRPEVAASSSKQKDSPRLRTRKTKWSNVDNVCNLFRIKRIEQHLHR